MIVVDTSVALQWLLIESDAAQAETLIARDDVAAPDIILLEAANVLSKKVRLKEIERAQASEGLRFLRANIPTLVPGDAIVDRAFEISLEISHPAYDCMFLACAERLEAKLVTRDAPFCKRVDERGFGHLLAGALA